MTGAPAGRFPRCECRFAETGPVSSVRLAPLVLRQGGLDRCSNCACAGAIVMPTVTDAISGGLDFDPFV